MFSAALGVWSAPKRIKKQIRKKYFEKSHHDPFDVFRV
jgi:hypothetical protein